MFIVCLAACQENLSYSYLMEHPFYLQKQLVKCQSKQKNSENKQTQCESVLTAAADFDLLLSEQWANSLQFGQRIMLAERDWISAKQELEQAKNLLETLQSKKQTSQLELSAASDRVMRAEKTYQHLAQEVRILLAVVSVTNHPE